MTIRELARELASEMGEVYSDPEIADQFDRFVAQASRDVLMADNWQFMHGSSALSSVAGTAEYDMSTGVPYAGDVGSVYNETLRVRLVGKSKEQLLRDGANLADSGTPAAWVLEGADFATGQLVLRLWPVPDAVHTYTVHFRAFPPSGQFTADDDIRLPFPALDAVRHKVRVYYFENSDEGSNEAAIGRWEARYAQAIEALRRKYVWSPGIDRQISFGDLPRRGSSFPIPRFPRTIDV
jgi:hypothetical protein